MFYVLTLLAFHLANTNVRGADSTTALVITWTVRYEKSLKSFSRRDNNTEKVRRPRVRYTLWMQRHIH
ncbi:hypothetical protein OSTOST_14067 [Ostertagia ostertagi]